MISQNLDTLSYILDDIHKNGYGVHSVLDVASAGVPYSYTVGLSKYAHPELLVAGLTGSTGEQVLRRVASQVVHNKIPLQVGDTLSNITASHNFRILDIHPEYFHLFELSQMLYEKQDKYYQVVFSDEADVYPWFDECTVGQYQRLLGNAHPGNGNETGLFGWVID